VVIVPELEANTRRGKSGMLSWLERGIAEPSEAGEATEFLVAPVQSKGTERGNAKAWVDHVRCERESQELRRLLYVAATRARDELHFFALPAWKEARDGSRELATPTNSLLATAWPAFEEEIRQRFDEWRAKSPAGEDGEVILEYLAAGAKNDPDESPKPTTIRRLPPDFCLDTGMHDAVAGDAPLLSSGRSYERHEGGLLPRAMGKAVHTLMQQLAQLLAAQSRQAALTALPGFVPSIAAGVRAAGVDAERAGRIANQALEIVQRAAIEPVGRWILAPHSDAASEVRWAGVAGGKVRTVQVDRVFRAGDAPLIDEGRDEQRTWWIVDYKTAHEDGLDPALALPELRRVFAPQVETYAMILRNLHGADIAIRAGLYYPRMLLLDWWAL
jgi:ATP-dependent helicase/nuclease subunit A